MRIIRKKWLFPATSLLSLIGVFCLSPIAQTPTFHLFADTRSWWEIPNTANVLSNLAFIVTGIYGLTAVSRMPVPATIRTMYRVLFVGVMLTGFGSAYYHWQPDNERLVWDRIPMTIVFMSFLAATIAELVSQPLGTRLLWPLVILGIGSVLWWHHTETLGRGDLRLYFWVQFYPMLAIPLLLWLYYTPAVKSIIPSLAWIVLWYVIAKILEWLDHPAYQALGISGHSLKHLAAAVSTWYFVQWFRVLYEPDPSVLPAPKEKPTALAWLDPVKKIVEILALIIGGSWALYNFNIKDKPGLAARSKASSTLKWDHPKQDQYAHAEFNVTLENNGITSFNVTKAKVLVWTFKEKLTDGRAAIKYYDLRRSTIDSTCLFVDSFENRTAEGVKAYKLFIGDYNPGMMWNENLEFLLRRDTQNMIAFYIEFYRDGDSVPFDWTYHWDFIGGTEERKTLYVK